MDFDKTKEYEKHVRPLLLQLFETCKQHDLPSVSMVVYKNTENEIYADSLADTHCTSPEDGVPRIMQALHIIMDPTSEIVELDVNDTNDNRVSVKFIIKLHKENHGNGEQNDE